MTNTRADPLRVPVVLPLIEVTIGKHGEAAITVDGEGYSEAPIERDDLPDVIQGIASLKGPSRVHVVEGDGSEFTDLVVANGPVAGPEPTTRSVPPSGFRGTGFLPDEDVDIAVVVTRHKADAAGITRFRVPPALLAGNAAVVLIGRTSGAFAVCERA